MKSLIDEQSSLYQTAYSYYMQGHYKEAKDLFTRLILSHPFEMSYWKGLASSGQMAGLYEEALKAWAMVVLLKSDDPYPHFHAAECYYSMGDKTEADKALSIAAELCREEDLNHKIKELKRLWLPS